MYLKLVGSGHYSRTHILPLEGIAWQKFVVSTKEEYAKICKERRGYWQPYKLPDELGAYYAVFVIELWSNGEFRQIILTQGTGFIMSPSGQTIDRVK